MTIQNVERVARDVAQEIQRQNAMVGEYGLYTHVYASLVRAYLLGVEQAKRPFSDVDALTLLELERIAKQSVSQNHDNYENPIAAASFAVMRAAFSAIPEVDTYGHPVRSGEELYKEMLDRVKGDTSQMEGQIFPDHWTMRDARIYQEHKRGLERAERLHRQGEAISQANKRDLAQSLGFGADARPGAPQAIGGGYDKPEDGDGEYPPEPDPAVREIQAIARRVKREAEANANAAERAEQAGIEAMARALAPRPPGDNPEA